MLKNLRNSKSVTCSKLVDKGQRLYILYRAEQPEQPQVNQPVLIGKSNYILQVNIYLRKKESSRFFYKF